ncbi:MAG TPA: hypothetical protein VF553_16480, partial [Pyrinomonadaceae bacterium]
RYSSLLGSDQLWSIGEVTGNRTLEFNNATGEPFSLDVLVTGFQNGATGGGAAGGGEAAQSTSSGGGSGSPTTTLSLPVPNTLLRITINPLTKTITSRVISR